MDNEIGTPVAVPYGAQKGRCGMTQRNRKPSPQQRAWLEKVSARELRYYQHFGSRERTVLSCQHKGWTVCEPLAGAGEPTWPPMRFWQLTDAGRVVIQEGRPHG